MRLLFRIQQIGQRQHQITLVPVSAAFITESFQRHQHAKIISVPSLYQAAALTCFLEMHQSFLHRCI